MLVTRHGNDVPRDQIFDYLWPDMDEERAKNNLYVAWSTMKSALMGDEPGRCPYIENVGGVCKVVSENLRSDVDEFEAALAAVRAAEKSGDTAAELAAYRRISDAYRGDLLPGDVYDDWFAQLREQFRSDFCQAMLRAAELLCDAEKPADGLAYVRRAIQTDPLREDLYQIALRCQIAAGQRGAAIDLYQQCKTRLADDLGLDPSAETRALYDRILAMEDAPITYGFDLLDD
jgi:DNA-binding SARP family transcriptional activator